MDTILCSSAHAIADLYGYEMSFTEDPLCIYTTSENTQLTSSSCVWKNGSINLDKPKIKDFPVKRTGENQFSAVQGYFFLPVLL